MQVRTQNELVIAALQHPNLHELVDQPNPAQADAVRAVVIQFVGREEPGTGHGQAPRRLSFAGTLSAGPDLAQQAGEILDEIVTRNAAG